MKKFSARLKSLRKEHSLTQEEISSAIQLQRSTYSGYENEGKEPDFDTVCRIAQYYEVTTDYLLGFSDEKSHIEQVFFNDRVNFERHYRAMPEALRPIVAECFDSFYLLLGRDMQLARSERLSIYQELLHTLQSLRAKIRRMVETSGGSIGDPVVLSDLMASQSQLKNEVSALLDKLMQADMEIALNIKKDVGSSNAGSSMSSAG